MRLCYSLVMFMALIMLTSGLSLIAACGKKGPLYHPSEVQQQVDKKKSDEEKNKKTSSNTKPQP